MQAQLVEPIVLELHSRRETAVPIPRSCRMICAAEVTDRTVRGPQKKGCWARTLRRLRRCVVVMDDVCSRRTRTSIEPGAKDYRVALWGEVLSGTARVSEVRMSQVTGESA